jgi:hypothetical protein
MSDTQRIRTQRPYALVIAFAVGVALATLVFMTWPKANGATQPTSEPAQERESPGKGTSTGKDGAIDIAATFPSWEPDSASLTELVSFVESVTDPASPAYRAVVARQPTQRIRNRNGCRAVVAHHRSCRLVVENVSYHSRRSVRSSRNTHTGGIVQRVGSSRAASHTVHGPFLKEDGMSVIIDRPCPRAVRTDGEGHGSILAVSRATPPTEKVSAGRAQDLVGKMPESIVPVATAPQAISGLANKIKRGDKPFHNDLPPRHVLLNSQLGFRHRPLHH